MRIDTKKPLRVHIPPARQDMHGFEPRRQHLPAPTTASSGRHGRSRTGTGWRRFLALSRRARRTRFVAEPSSCVTAYADAATTTADLVAGIDAGVWSGPGLGEWDLRALVGHTSRAMVTVLTYLDRPAHTEDVGSPEAYYALLSAQTGEGADAAAVAQRGRQSGEALGDDPAVAFRELAEQAMARLAAVDPDELIETIAGGIRIRCYVPTRTVELVVHGLDIAAAAGLPVTFSRPTLAEAATVLARTGVELGRGPELLAALTGRAALPPGFSTV